MLNLYDWRSRRRNPDLLRCLPSIRSFLCLSSSTIDTYFSGICSPFSERSEGSTLSGAVSHGCEVLCTVTCSSFRDPFQNSQALYGIQCRPDPTKLSIGS